MPAIRAGEWTEADRAALAKHYPDTPNRVLAQMFRRTYAGIKNAAVKQGLSKTADYMDTGPGQFKAGQDSWNKGMKGLDIGGKETRFKPGQRPNNWQPIGHERVGKGDILQRKATDTGNRQRDYRAVHALTWEAHYGPIPADHIVVFRDGNRRNFDISNLELISRAENMRRNSIHQLPPELANLCRMRGVLNRQLNKDRRHEHQPGH